MKKLLPFLLFLLHLGAQGEILEWEKLPPLPDREGFAGSFAGVISEGEEDFLFVAGGANFPAGRPWEGGKKVYYRDLFLLPLRDGGQWERAALTLPWAVGYGMSAPAADGSYWLIGGKDNAKSFDQVWKLSLADGRPVLREEGSLPFAVSSGVAATLNGRLIVAGGSDGQVVHRELLVRKNGRWERHGFPEEARGRMHPVGGVQGGKFYLFGGRDFASGDGTVESYFEGLNWLADCWEFQPDPARWRRLRDLPEARSAAPARAIPIGASSLLMVGGVPVDFLRAQVAARPELNGQGMDHPGFPGSLLSYNTVTDRWAELGEMPASVGQVPVTTPVVFWKDRVIIPSGEVKPGVRSPQVLVAKVGRSKLSFGLVNWLVVLFYLAAIVGVGYWFMRRNSASSTEAYFRGGQKIPFWVAGLSIYATMLSAITFMAVPGAAYAGNWNAHIGLWPIVLIVPLVVFFYLPFFRKLNITTAYQYLEMRFNLATRVIGSITFMLFHLGRVAIVLYLPALALSSVTDINIFFAVAVMGVLCVIYTVMGGIEAVVWTDAIQALILIGGALLCFCIVLFQVEGGIAAVGTAMTEQGKGFTASWRLSELSIQKGSTSGIILFVGFLFANLPSYTSGQDVVQRYVTTPTQREAAKSLWMNIGMVLVSTAAFFALGTALFVFYQNRPELMDPSLPANDSVLPFFIMQNLPVGVAGLVIASVFAAAQSTISSSLNSVATAFTTDLYARLFRPKSTDQRQLQVAKRVVVVVGLLGIVGASFLAAIKTDEVFMLFNRFIGFALGPLGGLFALGVFTKRASGMAGLIALVLGIVAVFSVYVLNEFGTINLMPLLYGTVGFMTTLLSGLLLGALMKPHHGTL